ncbi:uncharacterized protein I206_101066 [Kwoniella pini CBS 10737]|uniref:Uncharacterized protein n=1 Tax=Kwoniella pini CBS 10737 TaxID=1296096 RepID=A0A1B9IBI5_9TREE|nr:uncharacterized protein I206_00260 [Kwoniella pini CBS 10737]OCF52959.1 hypothetical protein I206_00260 [Kwoniella pini CBS 10737]
MSQPPPGYHAPTSFKTHSLSETQYQSHVTDQSDGSFAREILSRNTHNPDVDSGAFPTTAPLQRHIAPSQKGPRHHALQQESRAQSYEDPNSQLSSQYHRNGRASAVDSFTASPSKEISNLQISNPDPKSSQWRPVSRSMSTTDGSFATHEQSKMIPQRQKALIPNDDDLLDDPLTIANTQYNKSLTGSTFHDPGAKMAKPSLNDQSSPSPDNRSAGQASRLHRVQSTPLSKSSASLKPQQQRMLPQSGIQKAISDTSSDNEYPVGQHQSDIRLNSNRVFQRQTLEQALESAHDKHDALRIEDEWKSDQIVYLGQICAGLSSEITVLKRQWRQATQEAEKKANERDDALYQLNSAREAEGKNALALQEVDAFLKVQLDSVQQAINEEGTSLQGSQETSDCATISRSDLPLSVSLPTSRSLLIQIGVSHPDLNFYETAFSRVKTQILEMKKELSSEKTNKLKYDKTQDEVSRLQAQAQNELVRNKQLELKVETYEKTITPFLQKLEEKVSSLDNKTPDGSQLVELLKQRDISSNKILDLEKEKISLQKQLENLLTTCVGHTSLIEDFTRLLSQKGGEGCDAEAMLEDLSLKYKSQLKDKFREMDDLSFCLQQVRSKNNDLQAELDGLKDVHKGCVVRAEQQSEQATRGAEYEEKLKTMESVIRNLQAEKAEMDVKYQECLSKVDDLKDTVSELQLKALQTHEQILAKLEAKLEDRSDSVSLAARNSSKDGTSSETIIYRLQQDLQECRKELEKKKAELTDLQGGMEKDEDPEAGVERMRHGTARAKTGKLTFNQRKQIILESAVKRLQGQAASQRQAVETRAMAKPPAAESRQTVEAASPGNVLPAVTDAVAGLDKSTVSDASSKGRNSKKSQNKRRWNDNEEVMSGPDSKKQKNTPAEREDGGEDEGEGEYGDALSWEDISVLDNVIQGPGPQTIEDKNKESRLKTTGLQKTTTSQSFKEHVELDAIESPPASQPVNATRSGRRALHPVNQFNPSIIASTSKSTPKLRTIVKGQTTKKITREAEDDNDSDFDPSANHKSLRKKGGARVH